MFDQFKYMLTNYCFQKINIPDKKQRHVKTYTYINLKYHDRPSVNITSFADRYLVGNIEERTFFSSYL